MEGITFASPKRFDIPDYDYEPVRAIAKATNLDNYLANILDDATSRDDDDFTYGIPTNIVKRLHEAAKAFNWQVHAERIRKMGDHFKAQLTVSGIPDQGEIDVHFIHRKSSKPDAIPLLMIHGWPGSFLEFDQISQILSEKYHVVMPSIPGYAFSGAPKKAANTKGGVPWNFSKSAIVFNAIMLSLGYDKYVTQGGDWGSMLTRATAQAFPDNVKALHLNYFSGVTSKPDGIGELTDIEKRGIERLGEFRAKGSAYSEMQGTTPYTLGASLSCSPLALIFYIGEKMYRWSSPDTHPSADEVIANCMLYWFTGSITSSFWLYYCRRSGDTVEPDKLEKTVIRQPLAFGCGRYEIHWPVKKVFEMQLTDIRHWTVLSKGGHFLAMEVPEILAADMDKHFQTDEIRRLVGVGGPSSKI